MAQSADTLVALLEQRADVTPGDTPYVFLTDGDDGEARITYAQLRDRAKRIAVYLKNRGVTAGCPVLLIFHPGLDYICAFFGCLYAGAIPVPAYPPKHARQLGRLQSVIDDADTDFALTTAKELGGIHALAKKDKGLSIQGWLVLDDIQTSSADWADPGLDASQVALLQYTSGSTSSPKGVMVTHRNLLNNIKLQALVTDASPDDVFVFWLPPYHDFGLVGGILAPVVVGATCVLMRPQSFLLNPYRWLKAISDYGGTLTGAPNFAYDLCARAISAEQRATLDLSCLRVAFNGAEPIRAGTLDTFSEVFTPCGFRPEAWLAAYGLAEATLMVSGRRNLASQPLPRQAIFSKAALQDNRACIAAPGEDGLTLVSTGAVLPEHRAAIVDPHTLLRCEEGQAGEIWVSGPSVAKGYWKRPEETEQTFGAEIAGLPGEGYMRTGDLGSGRDDREAIAHELAGERGATVIPSSDYLEVIAGQGTATKELIEAAGPLDYLFVPIGGGGLLAGSAIAAAHLSPGCSIIGVEPEAGNDAQQSLRAGRIVRIQPPRTIADGARNQYIGKLVMPILQTHADEIVTVTDEHLIEQMRFFAETMKMVVEPTGCLAAAAVLNRIVDVSGARVGVIVSGGNVGANILGSYLIDRQAA